MTARCHWFWWSTSATESRYLWRIPSTIGRTAPRLAFSDRLSGTWRSKQTAAACTTPLSRAGVATWASAFGDEQTADFLDRVVLARAVDGEPHGRRTRGEAGGCADAGRAPDLADAGHRRQRRRRGEAAVGIQRHAVDLLTDDRTGQVGHDECVQPARLPEPGVAAGAPAADHAGRHPRVLVRRRPVRITGAHRSCASALPRSDHS